ncbi:MAG: hypothetical protein KDE09_01835 [Anaerolineales bacterium]|nr:hypothetical protein [Anaerolineales bacterium]
MERSSMPSLVVALADRWRWLLLVLGLSTLHLVLLLVNHAHVPHTYGYDWPGHFAYLFFVDSHGYSPPPEISAQFFNPPLYYLSVVAFQRITGLPLVSAGQIFNIGLALLTWGGLVAICRRLWADNLLPILFCLLLYATNSTIYRTFGMMRPEALLLPLFVLAAWVVLLAGPRPGWRVALLSGIVAGIAFGVRQWGVFLEAALGLWLFWMLGRNYQWQIKGRFLAILALQGAAFVVVAAGFLWLRGGDLLAFNAQAQPMNWDFVTGLELRTLFTQPVRPNLDSRFWPVLYADFWGDYWRYWWEALGRDPLPSSPATVAGLARAMWAGLPSMGLILLGLILPARWPPSQNEATRWLGLFARILIVVGLAGYLVFAVRYADAGKGDTVKSIYLVYLIPFAGILAALALDWLRSRHTIYNWVGWGSMALLILFVLPATVYRAPNRLLSRTWSEPEVAQRLDETFGQAYTLLGYDLAQTKADEMAVTLIWRADGYTGISYKVFVHLVAEHGEVVAQSDAIPAGWQRPTDAWMLGEIVTDVHYLTVPADVELSKATLHVGWYGGPDNLRLTTAAGKDTVPLPLGAIP